MSFDLMVFDKERAPNIFEDFLKWLAEQTEWADGRDYNSTDGTAPPLAAWFMAMKETFPPLNGPYSPNDDEAFVNADTENHLTDYTIGGSVIYGAFAWSAAEEAMQVAGRLAKKHGVGFFNPQTGDVFCDGMITCKIRTERHDDKTVTWARVEKEIQSLDSSERGSSHRDGAFITMFFAQNGTDNEFMQCMPDYPKPEGFIKGLFGGKKPADPAITAYMVEVGTGEKIYEKKVSGKDAVQRLFQTYYASRKLPDTSEWEDTGIL